MHTLVLEDGYAAEYSLDLPLRILQKLRIVLVHPGSTHVFIGVVDERDEHVNDDDEDDQGEGGVVQLGIPQLLFEHLPVLDEPDGHQEGYPS